MADLTARLQQQFDASKRKQGRCIAWEDALRRWKVRRQVKKYRCAVRESNESGKREALSQYRQCLDKLRDQMKHDPLLPNSHLGQAPAEHKFVVNEESGERVEFKWKDTDMTGGEGFVPDAVRHTMSEAQAGKAQERSGDRRKKLLEQQRLKRTADATSRLAKREEVTQALLERDPDTIMKHDYTHYQDTLQKQKAEVEKKREELDRIKESAKDKYADVLSDSD